MTYEYAAEQLSSLPSPWGQCGDDRGAPATVAAEAAEILDDVRRWLERDLDSARASAVRLAALLTPRPEPTVARGGLAPWQKRKIEHFLSERLEETIRIEELAELVSLSVSHFCRVFKDSFGVTPHAHIMSRRVALAQRLMVTTNEPLSQVALACGLADQAHLTKLFRRAVGQTPSVWRRLNATGEGRRPAAAEVGAF